MTDDTHGALPRLTGDIEQYWMIVVSSDAGGAGRALVAANSALDGSEARAACLVAGTTSQLRWNSRTAPLSARRTEILEARLRLRASVRMRASNLAQVSIKSLSLL